MVVQRIFAVVFAAIVTVILHVIFSSYTYCSGGTYILDMASPAEETTVYPYADVTLSGQLTIRLEGFKKFEVYTEGIANQDAPVAYHISRGRVLSKVNQQMVNRLHVQEITRNGGLFYIAYTDSGETHSLYVTDARARLHALGTGEVQVSPNAKTWIYSIQELWSRDFVIWILFSGLFLWWTRRR